MLHIFIITVIANNIRNEIVLKKIHSTISNLAQDIKDRKYLVNYNIVGSNGQSLPYLFLLRKSPTNKAAPVQSVIVRIIAQKAPLDIPAIRL